jgi:mRNA interferase YafQ
MAKYDLDMTVKFKRDIKKAKKRGLDIHILYELVDKLLNGEQLPEKNHDHLLSGEYEGLRECHIQPDWLLIYDRAESIKLITLQRTGTHSDLFKKKSKK